MKIHVYNAFQKLGHDRTALAVVVALGSPALRYSLA